MTNDAITSVIAASASATGKVFVIGAIGYISAIRPKPVPILPPHAMNAISKMNFNLLILPLVYSTLASAVTPDKLGSLWFVLVAGIAVISLSYIIATLLGKLPFFRVENKTDFDALRIAAAFPNIVALPILIFPTLCEYPVVYNSFYEGDINDTTEGEKFKSCVDQSNAMIFIYFFAWNLLYWILGYPTLVSAGERRQSVAIVSQLTNVDVEVHEPEVKVEEDGDGNEIQCNDTTHDERKHKVVEDNEPADTQIQSSNETRRGIKYVFHLVTNAFIQTLKSPGFVAMVLGFITACIPPLSNALFSQGGALRFLGSALESLGGASSSVGTLVVAASLVHQAAEDDTQPRNAHTVQMSQTTELGIPLSSENTARRRVHGEELTCNNEETIQQQQSSNDLRESMRRRRSSISQMSMRAMAAIRRRKPTIRMHTWFIFSRLIITPAVVCLMIIAMDCGGVLDNIPNLAMAKMVIIVNAGLPGAQLIVLTLKSKGLSDSASVVARVYLPSYLLSVVTIAAWASLGLIISVPRPDGASFCKR